MASATTIDSMSSPGAIRVKGSGLQTYAAFQLGLKSCEVDPWYRRNHLKLIGGGLVIVVVIVVSVVLTADSGNSSPTMAATTEFEGTQSEVLGVIVSEFPSVEVELRDTTTSQYRALVWVTQALGNRSIELDNVLAVMQQCSLVSLYLSTSSSETKWERSDGWMTDPDECTWSGVRCNEDGEVVTLTVPNNGLKGHLPIDLAMLSRLSALDLSGNQLSGSIPSELESLTMMQSFDLSKNDLLGSVNMEFAAMTDLETLVLGDNQLTSTLSVGT